MGDVRAGVGLGEVRGVRKVGTMMTMSLFLLLFCLFWCVCVSPAIPKERDLISNLI